MPDVTIGANTYTTNTSVADADVYLGGDVLRATSWSLRNSDAKGRGLVSATRLLAALPWNDGVPDTESHPAVVDAVTCMLAADLLSKPKLFADASANSQIKSAKAGSAAVEFFKPTENSPPLPLALWRLLELAGLVGTVGGDFSTEDGPYVGGQSGVVDCPAPGVGWDFWGDPSRGLC